MAEKATPSVIVATCADELLAEALKQTMDEGELQRMPATEAVAAFIIAEAQHLGSTIAVLRRLTGGPLPFAEKDLAQAIRQGGKAGAIGAQAVVGRMQ